MEVEAGRGSGDGRAQHCLPVPASDPGTGTRMARAHWWASAAPAHPPGTLQPGSALGWAGLGWVGSFFTLKPNEVVGACRLPATLALPCAAGPGELDEVVFRGQRHGKARAGARCCTQGTGVPGSPPAPHQHRSALVALGPGLSPMPALLPLPSCLTPLERPPTPNTGDFAPLGVFNLLLHREERLLFPPAAALDPGRQPGAAGSRAREHRPRGLHPADARLSRAAGAGRGVPAG